MNKSKMTMAAAVVVVALGAAYPASSWYLGKQIEAVNVESNKMLAKYPYIKVLRNDYARSLFGATEVITLEVPASLLKFPERPAAPKADEAPEEGSSAKDESAEEKTAPPAPAEPAPAAEAKPLPPIRITFKTSIQHGPFPGFSAFGAGSAHTTVEFEGPLQKRVSDAFGGKPLEAITRYDFSGGGESTFTIPPLKAEFKSPEGDKLGTLTGESAEIRVGFTRGMKQITTHIKAPRYELTSEEGVHVLMAGLQLDGQQQRLLEDDPLFYSGTQNMSLGEMSLTVGEENDKQIAFKGIKYEEQIAATGDFFDVIAKMGAQELRFGEKNYGPAHYDLSLKHLHARKTLALYRGFLDLYKEPEKLQKPEQMMQAMKPLKDKLVAVLVDNPVLTLDRISFTTPQGEAKLSASLKLLNPKAEDFANPLMLPAKLDLAADIAVPEALISGAQGDTAAEGEKGMGAAMGQQMIQQTLSGAIEQGYVTREGALLKTRLKFSNGQLQLNDKPFNPMSMAQPPAAPAAPAK